ncbi:Acetylpolyamine aminohydrolase [Enhygromyxa salina]|uniref:Acetylpolyamine aminohydrolase n=1 Tax=Enhygromyxa salina TaxID=215803 RepID=A0A2S9YNL5_9BACT|nr:Acetylpolyamine aminohydrolase [Enhygromyxa salina]
MFSIRRLNDLGTPAEHARLEQVQTLFREAFPDVAEYADTLPEQLGRRHRKRYQIVLMTFETARGRVRGFALAHYHADLAFGYLDYLVGSTSTRAGGGRGGALYEALRDTMKGLGATGMFMDVPPDEPAMVADPARLPSNRARLRFYERYGARPIIGTAYDGPPPLGQTYDPPFLVYDPLDGDEPLDRARARKIVAAILSRKYGWAKSDPYTRRIVASFEDDPVQLRAPRYAKRATAKVADAPVLHLVVSEHHEIHHVRERGYVERPARVTAILDGLRSLTTTTHAAKHRALEAVCAVHDREFVRYLDRMCRKLAPTETLYPYVFPLRRPERKPKDHWVRAGYYCIDTFTPLSQSALAAARGAVDCALTGADLLAAGHSPVYALCRPPGHHAERRVFGGFCYFNNAALAADALASRGRVAFLDIDYHHGNGSQDIFYDRSDVLFVSLHGHPRTSYPYFCGFADERGVGAGEGFNLNVPLREDTDDATYLRALERGLKAIRKFDPAYVVISLGFDIMQGDPTGGFRVTPEGMRGIGAALAGLERPTLFVQEGGYALRNLRRGGHALFDGFCGSLRELE